MLGRYVAAATTASDQTTMAIARHVSHNVMEYYSHIRTEARRVALDAIANAPNPAIIQAGMHQNGNQVSEGEKWMVANVMNLLVGLGRIELPTFPIRSGRSRQQFNPRELQLVGLGRVELPTSPLSGVRSSHLSYRPVPFSREGRTHHRIHHLRERFTSIGRHSNSRKRKRCANGRQFSVISSQEPPPQATTLTDD